MPTDRTLITVSDLVREATAIVDPQGKDPAVVSLLERFGDDDEEVLLRLSARAEFDGHPPEGVVTWLSERGVELT